MNSIPGATEATDQSEVVKPAPYRPRATDYALILKPRVMSLVVFTGLVGLILAPGTITFADGLMAILCIALGAGASGAINMWYDRDIDCTMQRTMNRPIPAGRMPPGQALAVGSVLSVGAVTTMAVEVNFAAAGLLAITILYYVFIYTIWLKRRTPQNIVIGGAAGAFPPMIGWTAVTGDVSWGSFSLFLIIMLWTPPHSWALALFSKVDYERAGVPMLPVVAGVRETKKQIVAYTLLLVPSTLLPWFLGVSGWLYAGVAGAMGIAFFCLTLRLWREEGDQTTTAKSLFGYSILYLFLIFVFLVVDRAVLSML
jgi:protoheme IX farnesyltransferase